MASLLDRPATSTLESRKQIRSLQVMLVHKTPGSSNQEGDHHIEGISIRHASLSEARTFLAQGGQIDALTVRPECRISEIESLRNTISNKIPLILQTTEFDWRAKEIAIESGVDDYHIGYFDERFIKMVMLIQRIKAIADARPARKWLFF